MPAPMGAWIRLCTFAVAVTAALAGCAGSTVSPPVQQELADFGDVEATATTGVIRGVVIDEAIRPIFGATVVIASLGTNTTTNDNGAFVFEDLEPGTYFLQVSKLAYTSIQASVDVAAGIDEPPVVKVALQSIPSLQPYVDALSYSGFLSLGVAVIATSVGTTAFGPLGEALGDRSIWVVKYDNLPLWAQGELVWTHNQPAGGELIWEMTDTSNDPAGYRETIASPALAYWNTTVIQDHNESTLDPERGIAYRFFGGPHPLCKPIFFGCGLTVQQRADAYIHNFYNFVPNEGWRFTRDGPHPVPT